MSHFVTLLLRYIHNYPGSAPQRLLSIYER